MAQDKIKMNSTEIRQPDSSLGYSFETTYAEDATRSYSGALHATALYTVEQLSYSAKKVTKSEMSTILGIIARGGTFTLHYFSPFYGTWRDGSFYVGKGNLSIGALTEDGEFFDSLSFNMTGVNPI